MPNWIPLQHSTQLAEIIEQSNFTPCLILKHSTSCGISQMAKFRLDEDWNFAEGEVLTYLLDVLTFRQLAKEVAQKLSVPHESPQLILIRGGFCTYDASHLDISVEELRECFEDTF